MKFLIKKFFLLLTRISKSITNFSLEKGNLSEVEYDGYSLKMKLQKKI